MPVVCGVSGNRLCYGNSTYTGIPVRLWRTLFHKRRAGACFLVWLVSAVLFLPVLQASSTRINGVRYLSLQDVAGDFGMRLTWIKQGHSARMESRWSRIGFTADDRRLIFNGVIVYCGYPVAFRQGRLYIAETDYENNLIPLLTPQKHLKSVQKLYRIVIDPGHGGKDPGAVSKVAGLVEKDLTLDIARRLKAMLEKEGYRIYLTRSDDRFLSLSQRVEYAKKVDAEMFISIHFNSARTTAAKGMETYVLTPYYQPSTARTRLHSSDKRTYNGNRFDPWNALIGYHVQRQMLDTLKGEDRGVKRARFYVIKEVECPALLVEPGFISNSGEANRLKSPDYRQLVARSIADGVLEYQQTIDRIRGR